MMPLQQSPQPSLQDVEEKLKIDRKKFEAMLAGNSNMNSRR